MPGSMADVQLTDFEFEKRRVLFPATINGKSKKLLFDSGSSAFEFITDKDTWYQMAKPQTDPVVHDVNSWGNTLRTYSIESNETIDFGVSKVQLNKVTYIEGIPFFQQALMRISGMGGMISNKLFDNKALVIDAKHKKFGILYPKLQQQKSHDFVWQQ